MSPAGSLCTRHVGTRRECSYCALADPLPINVTNMHVLELEVPDWNMRGRRGPGAPGETIRFQTRDRVLSSLLAS